MKKVLIIGSGALKIGEAGEFDYSGTQALKALKEEDIETVLVNPNIATVQTSEGIADKIYFLPILPKFIEKVIQKENPDGILLSFGGQTALNCGLELFKNGTIKKYNLKVLGTPVESIIASEDRGLFCDRLNSLQIKTARSRAVISIDEAFIAAEEIGFPLIIRSAYALGGLGSGFVNNRKKFGELVEKALAYSPQILIEESLKGWKEIEYEVVRDCYDNCITVCNMENFDPIGIHTGESIVVAPSQTLTDSEYQNLRNLSITIARNFGIIGECNVQFALSTNSEDYRVIEINARLSRSSALASKATGYPLAFIAAKLSLGYGLHELKNVVTQSTSAFFEPAFDYIVCKLPRWDLKKFYGVSNNIGSSMKSVGEVMAIGGSFEESLQKGIRMLDIGLEGFANSKENHRSLEKKTLEERLQKPTDRQIENLEEAFDENYTVEKLYKLTQIDPWFLYKLQNIHQTKKLLSQYTTPDQIPKGLLHLAKKQGFSDIQIARILNFKANLESIAYLLRMQRKSLDILPYVRQIDTLAAEYPTRTNYLYMTYHASCHDIKYEKDCQSVVVLGSGVYRIGSSVEFDWCCVNTLKTLHKEGYRSIMINCNPETVSTDFDECDRLYFEEINLERVLDILDLEEPKGVIVSMGGQIPNNLAIKLHNNKQNILGSSVFSIDEVENRYKFSKALDDLKIKQPRWRELSTIDSIHDFIEQVGYPVLIRPSYVLSGASMHVVSHSEQLVNYLRNELELSLEHPVVISKFIENAKEIELDAVSYQGEILYHAISEHVEFAGVHSGDATLVYPPQNIYLSTLKRVEHISRKISKYFKISGPFNIQFLLKNNCLEVIECNLRASRSFPFISKISGFNMIQLATKAILGNIPSEGIKSNFFSINHIGIKSPQFSFSRLQGSDPVLGVDMASTGEAGALGINFNETLIKAMLSVGYTLPEKNILISGASLHLDSDLLEVIKLLIYKDYCLFATEEIHKSLKDHNISSFYLCYPKRGCSSSVLDYIHQKKLDLVINIPKNLNKSKLDNDYIIRRASVDFNIPLLTNVRLACSFIRAFCNIDYKDLAITEWKDYFLENLNK